MERSATSRPLRLKGIIAGLIEHEDLAVSSKVAYAHEKNGIFSEQT
jgi:hypothetical protein